MNKVKGLIVGLALLVSISAFSDDFGQCNVLFPNSHPPDINNPDSRELCFSDFAVLYSTKTKTPIYSVERLNYLSLRNKVKRTNHFHEEPKLRASERSTLEDYKGSGYDRGHMSPAADRTSDLAMEDSFTLANMAPQAPANNRGVWAKNVEKPTRKFAMRAQGYVYVFTGPYFLPTHKVIGRNYVWVPDYLFKLVYDSASGRSWVYWLPNTDGAVMTKPISYEEFVSKTGMHLLNR